MTKQITFFLHEEEERWWAELPLHGYTAVAETKDELIAMCREGVEFLTGYPASSFNIVYMIEPKAATDE